MKNQLSFIGGMLLLIIVSSCTTEQPDPQFDISQVIGIWEKVGGDNYVACPSGEKIGFKITETQIIIENDDNGCPTTGALTVDYIYTNGNTLDAGVVKYKITSLSATDMTLQMTSIVVAGTNEEIVLVKKQ